MVNASPSDLSYRASVLILVSVTSTPLSQITKTGMVSSPSIGTFLLLAVTDVRPSPRRGPVLRRLSRRRQVLNTKPVPPAAICLLDAM